MKTFLRGLAVGLVALFILGQSQAYNLFTGPSGGNPMDPPTMVGPANAIVTGVDAQFAVSFTPVATAAAIGASQQTFTATGVLTTDKVVVVGPVPNTLCPMTGARVSAANTVQVDFTTLTAVACTPTAGTYLVVAIH